MLKNNISTQVVEALGACEKGKVYKRKDIIKIVVDFCNCNPESVIPSDYCYNRLNDGIDYEKTIHLFEYEKRNHYIYRGLNYNYCGPVFHKPKKGKEYQIGEVTDGKFTLFESDN